MKVSAAEPDQSESAGLSLQTSDEGQSQKLDNDLAIESVVLRSLMWSLRPSSVFRLRGRIDTDAIWSSQSPANHQTFGDLGDVVALRRARVGAEGEFGINGRYVAEIDLATGSVVPRDVFAGFGDVQEMERRAGHFREAFSLEGGTSANTFAFVERSPINVLDPARNWGLGLFQSDENENTTLALGIFHSGTDSSDFQGGVGSTVGLTGRVTAAVVNEGDGERLLHLGLALSERLPETGVIVINQKPRSPLLDLDDSSLTPFNATIRLRADFQQLANLQFAAVNGSVWTQAEWYGTFIHQRSAGPVFFRGGHLDVGYFITGEHRDYRNGVFGPLRVNRPLLRCGAAKEQPLGWGAYELTARFAYLNFLDADTPADSGGLRLTQWTIGANWYLADHLRVMLNYSYALPDERNGGSSVAHIFSTRLAMFW